LLLDGHISEDAISYVKLLTEKTQKDRQDHSETEASQSELVIYCLMQSDVIVYK